jgi:3-isopropylmalate/(R)-2-methylmalate dehydratase small subunit
VIAESFADIFYNNCSKNGVLPVVLTTAEVETIHQNVAAEEGYRLTIDLENNRVTDATGFSAGFEIDAYRRQCFLEGLDHIALTLKHEEKISEYEKRLSEAR